MLSVFSGAWNKYLARGRVTLLLPISMPINGGFVYLLDVTAMQWLQAFIIYCCLLSNPNRWMVCGSCSVWIVSSLSHHLNRNVLQISLNHGVMGIPGSPKGVVVGDREAHVSCWRVCALQPKGLTAIIHHCAELVRSHVFIVTYFILINIQSDIRLYEKDIVDLWEQVSFLSNLLHRLQLDAYFRVRPTFRR